MDVQMRGGERPIARAPGTEAVVRHRSANQIRGSLEPISTHLDSVNKRTLTQILQGKSGALKHTSG